jgi:hypothetical protein
VIKSLEVTEKAGVVRSRWEVGVSRFEVEATKRSRKRAAGGELIFCGGDHGSFYCLDIIITNNKKDRVGNCTNGQDFGR